ncbi:MAG: cysteine synthase family protein [Thaumarchaeota archaeon]|nr:cysteine synthase family protein [Candidatus Calditenuaceae archaeon]MDW8186727.1 cysteine synthase family protein [Nitrososphaerota archaeon]
MELGSVLSAIGRTPMIDLTRLLGDRRGVRLMAKAEFMNPGGSVKDRPALYIVMDALRSGALTQEKRILDATSGNMGLGLALVGASLGIGVTLVVPGSISQQKLALLRYLGSEIIVSDALEGIDGAIRKAREIYESDPKRYFYANQYDNPSNLRAHYETTGPEIIEQTLGKVTHFVAGVGTSGTLMGAGKRLKEVIRDVRLVEVQPAEPLHGIEGLKNMYNAIVPKIYDDSFADVRVFVRTEDAYNTARVLARRFGLLTGPSAGANVYAAISVAQDLEEGLVVTVLPDSASRYIGLLT